LFSPWLAPEIYIFLGLKDYDKLITGKWRLSTGNPSQIESGALNEQENNSDYLFSDGFGVSILQRFFLPITKMSWMNTLRSKHSAKKPSGKAEYRIQKRR
jgi:hypothetical protein